MPTATSQRYVGTVGQTAGGSVPMDLSLFFGTPIGAQVASIRQIFTIRPQASSSYPVTGGYTVGTGSTSFSGSLTGTLTGSPDNGTFNGVLNTRLSNGCTPSTFYSGQLTATSLNWTPGSQIDSCNGASPLTFVVAVPASNAPVTVGSTIPTTIPAGTTTTSTIPGTTTSTSTSVTSTSTSTSSTSTTTSIIQSFLSFSFSSNPVPTSGLTTSCSGGATPFKSWFFRLTIQNTSNVPFTVSSWTLNSPQGLNQTNPGGTFSALFDTPTIPANGSASASLCVWFTTASSGSVTYTFFDGPGNGPFTTPTLQLSQ